MTFAKPTQAVFLVSLLSCGVAAAQTAPGSSGDAGSAASGAETDARPPAGKAPAIEKKTVAADEQDDASVADPDGDAADAAEDADTADTAEDADGTGTGEKPARAHAVRRKSAGAAATLKGAEDSSSDADAAAAGSPSEKGQPSGPRVIEAEPEPAAPEEEVPANELPYTYHQHHFDVAVGLRGAWVPSTGYDAFSENDALVQFDARAGWAFWATHRFSLAVLGMYSVGSSGASARGNETSLLTHQPKLGIEGRYHVHERLFLHGRLAPGALLVETQLGAIGTQLSSSGWGFAGDAAVGATVRLAGEADGRLREPRLHLYLEAGGTFTSDVEQSLSSPEDGPARTQPVTLEPVNLSSPFVSGGLMFTW